MHSPSSPNFTKFHHGIRMTILDVSLLVRCIPLYTRARNATRTSDRYFPNKIRIRRWKSRDAADARSPLFDTSRKLPSCSAARRARISYSKESSSAIGGGESRRHFEVQSVELAKEFSLITAEYNFIETLTIARFPELFPRYSHRRALLVFVSYSQRREVTAKRSKSTKKHSRTSRSIRPPRKTFRKERGGRRTRDLLERKRRAQATKKRKTSDARNLLERAR